MERILKKIIDVVTRLFNRIIDEEAKRVNEFHCYIFGAKSIKGGEN